MLSGLSVLFGCIFAIFPLNRFTTWTLIEPNRQVSKQAGRQESITVLYSILDAVRGGRIWKECFRFHGNVFGVFELFANVVPFFPNQVSLMPEENDRIFQFGQEVTCEPSET